MLLVPQRELAARAPAAGGSVPERYVTDGRRLFRIVAPVFDHAESMFALLEDCVTLDIEPYSPGELYALGLRRVEAQPESYERPPLDA